MARDVDYLEIEDGTHAEGSWNHAVKNLVDAVRFMRERVNADEIGEHVPVALAYEAVLQDFEYIGEPDRQYYQEVWATLDAEPHPDDTRTFTVYELRMTKQGFRVLIPTSGSFYYHRKAVRWVKENGKAGKQYCIQEVLTIAPPSDEDD